MNHRLVCIAKDHPRLRGYYFFSIEYIRPSVGSPPLARVLPYFIIMFYRYNGITPAHAGTTNSFKFWMFLSQDHPRSRGYYVSEVTVFLCSLGSPPLTRVLRKAIELMLKATRITPAHAGTTPGVKKKWAAAWDHPRSRGYYTKKSLKNTPSRY